MFRKGCAQKGRNRGLTLVPRKTEQFENQTLSILESCRNRTCSKMKRTNKTNKERVKQIDEEIANECHCSQVDDEVFSTKQNDQI